MTMPFVKVINNDNDDNIFLLLLQVKHKEEKKITRNKLEEEKKTWNKTNHIFGVRRQDSARKKKVSIFLYCLVSYFLIGIS